MHCDMKLTKMVGMEMNYKYGQSCRQCEAPMVRTVLRFLARQETRQSSSCLRLISTERFLHLLSFKQVTDRISFEEN